MGRVITLDTGALIALDNRKAAMMKTIEVARQYDVTVLVPVNAVAEWWRGNDSQREILELVTIMPCIRLMRR